MQIFPTLIRLPFLDIPLDLHGPMQEFTIEQNLEKGCIWISGHALEGHFRLQLLALQETIELSADRAPQKGILCNGQKLLPKEKLAWKWAGLYLENAGQERLSLGSHKSQDWMLVWRRMDLSEILPILFHLSQWTPETPFSDCGMARLLEKDFSLFLRAAFFGILAPRLVDDQHQGLLPPEKISESANPCSLIAAAGEKIRRLFVEEADGQICFPPQKIFSSGRMTNVQLSNIGALDLLWSKCTMQQMVLRAHQDADVRFYLPGLGSFRLRRGAEKGLRKFASDALHFQAGQEYWLDQFQK